MAKQTSPSNTQRFFSAFKIENFIGKKLIFLIFLLKTLIVGIRYNCLCESILMSTHNLLWIKNENDRYAPVNPHFHYVKVG